MQNFSKKLIFISLLTAFAFLNVNAQTGGSSPETTIKGFYKWYIGEISKNKFPLTEQPAKMKQFITVGCYKLYRNIYDKKEFEADYFIAAQDWDEKWATNVKISNLKINANKATANVILDGKGDFDSKLKLKLIRQQGIWKIDVFDGQSK
jgi:Protein of unknown function (DUF3828)